MSRRKKNSKEDTAAQITRELPIVPAPGEGTGLPAPAEPIRIPLIHENLEVDKQWVEAGAVLLRKRVESRTETVPVELGYEEVQVERVPVHRVLRDDEDVAPRQEGNTLVIPVVEEELVVVKRRVVREEIRVNKRYVTRQEQVSDVVRSEQVDV